ncbi:MAG: hypothetical protein BA864_03275 [Desulfuromonadales bacterium C00003093]|nr:MAG: hypothetical protein BA864_03275 [Desulfuromonadales bacterium C00003093]
MLNLHEIIVRPVLLTEEQEFQKLMAAHHYLGALPKIGETLWYVALQQERWVALMTFSAAAWKCAARDQWIGWDFRHQYDRLKLVVNNSRFLILPDYHVPNLGTRILALSQKRLLNDWLKKFGHPVLLLETFVDPKLFQGTVYKAANWSYVGDTKGYRRTPKGYSDKQLSPKMVFVKPLQRNARIILSRAILDQPYVIGEPRIMIRAELMKTLPDFFANIPDPRRAQGQRHRLSTVLAIAAAATLCGMRGYRAFSDWANSLGHKAKERFRCNYKNGTFIVPSEYVIRNVLIRVDPQDLDQALQLWNNTYAKDDKSLAIDGKTMCNAIDEEGYQTHIMSAVGHQTKICYTQKKSAPSL